MTTSLTVRSAQFGDVQEIARLSLELGYPTTIETTASSLDTLLNSTRYLVVVAPAPGNHLLGWLVAERRVWLESGEGVEITGLVVSSSARRLGVGRALVLSAEDWARQQGFRSIRVRSNVLRVESHPFYQSIGFFPKKSQHVYEKPFYPAVG
jgi:GNAT superfamily N-acetyltransferase